MTNLQAVTAASADDIWNLERLETLGDSFLKFAVSYILYYRFPDLPEGKLTQVKGQILGNRNLFYCAKAKNLASYLKVFVIIINTHCIHIIDLLHFHSLYPYTIPG